MVSQHGDAQARPSTPRAGRSTPLAAPVDIDPSRNITRRVAGRRLHPSYGSALARLPHGACVFRGLPFDLGPRDPARRWVVADEPVTITLGADRPVSHVIVAHFCDTWLDDAGEREAGLPVGHVVPVGQPLARYTIEDREGRTWTKVIRRRFEVNDGLLGWGSAAFAAVGHLDNEPLDWRGPHAAQTPGRYAPAGQSGALTILPGTYGGNQTGTSDLVPSPTDDIVLWLHAIELDGDAIPAALHLEPLTGGRPGSAVLLAAVSLFRGRGDPLYREARFQVRVGGAGNRPQIDLGTVIRVLPAATRPTASADASPALVGWGSPRDDAGTGPGDLVVDLATAVDAVIDLDGWRIPGAALLEGSPLRDPGGPRSIELLPSPEIPVDVVLLDPATGEPIPGRVRFTAADGRYLPPDGHRDEVNPGLYEDTGADLALGASTYAYVDGDFSIRLPPGTVEVEAIAGFERRPVRTTLRVEPLMPRLEIPLHRELDMRAEGWVAADGHVHFLAPSSALLQAAAEDLDLVHLLATQWGDLFTNVSDLPWGSMRHPAGRPMVVVGTENRQNVLGHLALLGARRPTRPLASGGPPEGPIGGALRVLLADWADQCRAAGGLVIGAHFPLPYAEIAADIVAGKIDALEAQALSPGMDDPTIAEWYRYLRLGYRIPIVAGTDKMTAEVPVGAVRTYARVQPDGPLTFDHWAAAVRAGRTFITSGPVVELSVDGHEPGDVIRLPSPGRLEVTATARAAQPMISTLELVVDGRVVAATTAAAPSTRLELAETIRVEAGAWIASRSRGPSQIESAFTTSMAAHTSPVYVEVDGRPQIPPADDARVVEQVMLGARTWVAQLAAVADPRERTRMLAFFDGSLDSLARRMRGPR